MNFLKILNLKVLNLLAIIAISVVNASENNTNISDDLHLSNYSSGVSSSINDEPFSYSLSTIIVDSSKSSVIQSNISIIANTSDTLHLSNSSIDMTINIDHEDHFNCDLSAIEENNIEEILNTSFYDDVKIFIEDMQISSTNNSGNATT